MAIIGLTDQQAALPIIGELRKGEKKPAAGNAPGRDLTYFRFTSQDGEVVKSFYEEYPAEPRKINVFLPHAKAVENFDAWMEHWVAGGLVHRCDGHVTALLRQPDGSYTTEPHACPGKCKQVGRLVVIVPELGRLATITVLTTSIHDIKNLMAQLRSYEALSGDLRGIPFEITRKSRMISTPMPDGKRARREKWLLSIETRPEWTRRKMAAMEQESMPQIPGRAGDMVTNAEYEVMEQLPAGITPFEDEDNEIFSGAGSLEELLFELNREFGVKETEAKARLKELGYTTFPADGNGAAREKSVEMYLAYKAAYGSES